MRNTIIILPLLLLAGCEYSYRYPCQDPANWGKLECNNEGCEADGTCTKHTVGPNISTASQEQTTEQNSEPQETTEASNTEISSDTSCTPVQSESKVVGHKPSKDVVMDADSDEYEPPVRTPPSMDEEVPVTMNTIVDTAAHNAATK